MLQMRAYGIEPSDLTDREMERLAQHIHDYVQEEHQPIETVHIEGYGEETEPRDEGHYGGPPEEHR